MIRGLAPTLRRKALQLRQRLLPQEFSIAIYRGPSPFALAPLPSMSGPILTKHSVTDVDAEFVADPFLVREDGQWHLYFEVMHGRPGARKGDIALATSADGVAWRYRGLVLREPFHLSYPYVFRVGPDHYMVPESTEAREVRLYRADPFPDRWVHAATLLSGPVLLDSCPFEYGRRWWMLTHTDAVSGTLRLFTATSVFGPWREHPASPVVRNDLRLSRGAGRVLNVDGRLVRFAQDCRGAYGAAVFALEITRIDDRGYAERVLSERPLLAGEEAGWNAHGMHHVDAHRLDDGSWIACVDGWAERARPATELVAWATENVRKRL